MPLAFSSCDEGCVLFKVSYNEIWDPWDNNYNFWKFLKKLHVMRDMLQNVVYH